MPTALITGTSTGIGRETALHFAREGYRVFAGARDPATVETHPNIIPIRLDVDQDDSVRDAVITVQQETPGIDVLVNNAGIGFAGAVEYVPLDQVRAGFETNFYGAVRVMQAVVPSMRERRAGTIVNVASVNAFFEPDGAVVDYGAAKAALLNVAKALSQELAPKGIRINSVSPGPVATDLWLGDGGVAATIGRATGADPDAVRTQVIDQGIPTGRFSTPEEVATLVALLASPRTANVTGSDYVIDGGKTM